MLQKFEQQQPLEYVLKIFMQRELKDKKQIQKLYQRIRASNAENQELKDQINKKDRQIEWLETENQELKDQIDEKDRRIEWLEDEIENYESEVDPFSSDGSARCNRCG